MYFSACFRISWRRQRQSLRLVMRVPSILTNGSGSFAIDVSSPGSLSAGTGQSALPFSTAPGPGLAAEPPAPPAVPPALGVPPPAAAPPPDVVPPFAVLLAPEPPLAPGAPPGA